MSDPALRAEPRSVVGKKVKRLRAQGIVPGVIYGPAVERPSDVSVNQRDFQKFFMTHGHSTLFDLDVDGQGSTKVFIREVQMDHLRRLPIHVDFFAPNLRKELDSPVPLALHDTPEGPGVFTTMVSEVVVHGLPADIPHRIVVDCSVLQEIGDIIRVGDLEIPDNVTLVTNPDEMVATLMPRAVEPVEEEEEEVEEAEAAGEAAAEVSGATEETESETAE